MVSFVNINCRSQYVCSKSSMRRQVRRAGLVVAVFVLGLSHDAFCQTTAGGPNDLIAQASAARIQNDIPRAIQLYSEAVARNPNWPDGWWFLGSLEYGTGAYAPAGEALSRYVAMVPTAGPAFALRGLCEFEIGQYSQALADIQRGLSLGAANQPRNEQILRYHEGMLQTRLGEYEGALRTYAFFPKHDIMNPELLVAIGLAGLRMPMLPKDAAVDQQPLLSAAGQATYAFLAGDENAASQAFQTMFRAFPNAPNAHFLYGYLLFAHDPDSALEQFVEELKAVPSNIDADVMAAWALLLRNRSAEALPFAQAAVHLKSGLASAQLVLGKALVENGVLGDGITHLKTALQLEPNNLEAHLALAKAYSKSGLSADARRERTLCLQLTRTNGDSVEHP